MRSWSLLGSLVLLSLVACGGAGATSTPVATPTAAPTATVPPTPTPVVSPSPTPVPEALWVVQFGSSGDDFATGVAVDGDGDIYIVGRVADSLPGQTFLGGRSDAYIRKYDKDGNELWTRQFGTAVGDFASEVAVDADGNAYVVGRTEGVFSGQSSLGGGNDAYLRKYSPDGVVLWTRQFGSGRFDSADGVGVDGAGNVYVVGDTTGALPEQTGLGGFDGFLRKYDGAGTEIWTRQFGTVSDDFTAAVAVDRAGNAYVAGRTSGVFTGETGLSEDDAYIRKYDPDGNEIWTRQFATGRFDEAISILADTSGDVLVVGAVGGTLPGQTSAGPGSDAYVRKYDVDGIEVWTRQFGARGSDFATSVVIDGAGNIYVTGSVDGPLPGLQALGVGSDIFVRKYDAHGTEVWTRQFGTRDHDIGGGAAFGNAGNLYITGSTKGIFDGQESSGERDAYLLKMPVAP